MAWREDAKRRAAHEAAKYVKDGYVVGLGTGSTAALVLKEIGRRIRTEEIKILGVPTSYQAFLLAVNYGIPTTTLKEHPQVDVDIDGTDQIDEKLNLIKGMGGALTKEKIVAASAKRFIVVADETKFTDNLGANQKVPVEILPFAEPLASWRIEKLGGKPLLRERKDGIGPFLTDSSNFLLDVDFGFIRNPAEMNKEIKSIPGVIENGLFVEMAHLAILGTEKAFRIIRKS